MSADRNKHHMRGFHRVKRWIRHNQKTLAVGTVLGVIVAAVLGVWLYQTLQEQRERHITADNSVNMGSGYRNLTYKGKRYQYNSLITTVLYAGLDSEGEMTVNDAYGIAPRADSIQLAVLDKKNKKMTVLAINRDTMTEIRRYSMNGRDRGMAVNHLCMAYVYGDGGKKSCELLREAVSNLLGGIPITEYVVSNRTSLPYINDLVGGVTVTVPNDDLVDKDPRFEKGATVTLDASNIEMYVRFRDLSRHFANEERMERQKSYITAYVSKLQDLLRREPEAAWKQIDSMDTHLQTSITKNKYLDLVNLLNSVNFADSDYCVLEGEDQAGEFHDEFYVDEEALQEKIIELFYEEV